MVDAQRAIANANAARSSALSPSTAAVQGDEGFTAAAYHSATLKDEDVHDLTEGEESLYSGSISSPYFYGSQMSTPTPQHQQLHARDDDELFPSYAGTPQQELDDQIRPTAWEYYYPPLATGASAPPLPPSEPAATPPAAGAAPTHPSRHPQHLPSRFPQDPQQTARMQPQNNLSGLRYTAATSAFPASSMSGSVDSTSSSMVSTSAQAVSTSSSRSGVKRPLERISASPMASPTVSIASSMLAMRNNPEALDLAHTSKALLTHASASKPTATAFAPTTINLSTNSINLSVPKTSPTGAGNIAGTAGSSAVGGRKVKKEAVHVNNNEQDPALGPATKKTKVSRERQLKINAASRRCRKKQKVSERW